MRVAVTANLDAAQAVHSATFQRAVSMSMDLLSQEGYAVEAVWVDDGASRQGGVEAAIKILAAGVGAVVGHYASDAALAAAPLYRQASLPLFLPAATAARLSGLAWRLCDTDADYIAWLADTLVSWTATPVYVETDGSDHGRSIEVGVKARIACVDDPRDARVLLFSGRFESALAYCKHHLRNRDPRLLVLTDDAQSDQLAAILGVSEAPIRVFGFSTEPVTEAGAAMAAEHRRRFSRHPGIYFFETVAAMQVAAQWPPHGERNAFDTVLGPVRFDRLGESRPRRFACYRLGPAGLISTPGAGDG